MGTISSEFMRAASEGKDKWKTIGHGGIRVSSIRDDSGPMSPSAAVLDDSSTAFFSDGSTLSEPPLHSGLGSEHSVDSLKNTPSSPPVAGFSSKTSSTVNRSPPSLAPSDSATKSGSSKVGSRPSSRRLSPGGSAGSYKALTWGNQISPYVRLNT